MCIQDLTYRWPCVSNGLEFDIHSGKPKSLTVLVRNSDRHDMDRVRDDQECRCPYTMSSQNTYAWNDLSQTMSEESLDWPLVCCSTGFKEPHGCQLWPGDWNRRGNSKIGTGDILGSQSTPHFVNRISSWDLFLLVFNISDNPRINSHQDLFIKITCKIRDL